MEEVPEELGRQISELDIWGVEFGRLATRIEFEDYGNAVRFANKVFDLAKEESVHPVVKVEEKAVEIDIGESELTEEDIEMAGKLEEILRNSDFN